MTTVHEAFYGAADLIDERGLWKPGLGSGVCAVIALLDATDADTTLVTKCERALLASLGIDPGDELPCKAVYAWNDDHTQVELTTALRSVAAVAEAQAIIAAANALDAPVVVGARA